VRGCLASESWIGHGTDAKGRELGEQTKIWGWLVERTTVTPAQSEGARSTTIYSLNASADIVVLLADSWREFIL